MLILETGEPNHLPHIDLVIGFPMVDNICWINLCMLSLITRVKSIWK